MGSGRSRRSHSESCGPSTCGIPCADLDHLCVLSDDDRLITWDLSAEPPVMLTERAVAKIGGADSHALSPDGQLLAAWSGQSKELWLSETGPPGEWKLASVHDGKAGRPMFSRDGRLAATSGSDAFVRVWNTPPAKSCMQPGNRSLRRLFATGSPPYCSRFRIMAVNWRT